MEPKEIKDLNKPIVLHVRGSGDWTYLTRLYWAFRLLLGDTIHYHFCNSLRATFHDAEQKEFLGLEYTGATAKLGVGELSASEEAEIENLHPVTHIILSKRGKDV